MNSKLDMGQAWNDAVAMLSANKGVIAIVAGVFFFLPNVILTLMMPQAAEMEALAASGAADDPQALIEMMSAVYAENWYLFVLNTLFSAIGMIGLLALLARSSRPTVGEALGIGAKSMPTYIAAQILTVILLMIALLAPIALGAMISQALAAVLGIVGFVVMVYLMVKFSLSSAVIAIENTLNPITALQRSWEITKGNSVRIFGFYVLLLLVLVVIGLVAGMMFSIFAIMGDQIGLFVNGIGGGLLNAVFACVMLAVIAAVHRQLTGSAAADVTETFE